LYNLHNFLEISNDSWDELDELDDENYDDDNENNNLSNLNENILRREGEIKRNQIMNQFL
jgi:hypothetical protein